MTLIHFVCGLAACGLLAGTILGFAFSRMTDEPYLAGALGSGVGVMGGGIVTAVFGTIVYFVIGPSYSGEPPGLLQNLVMFLGWIMIGCISGTIGGILGGLVGHRIHR